MMKKCVIFGAGEYTGLNWKRQIDDFVIAADGGYKKLLEIGERPDLLIGDMDSLNDQALVDMAINAGIEVEILPTCKDDTDILAAIKIGLSRDCTVFDIYGALGGRLDHTIGNLQCLAFLQGKGAKGYLYDAGMRTELICNEKVVFPKDMKGTFSAFAYGGDAYEVTISGLKYEVENALIRKDFPIGVSNEFTGKESYIEVRRGMLLIHYCFL